MDTLITLLIFGAAALLSVIFKRKQEAGQDAEAGSEPTRPRPTPGRPAERRPSWEEELRRLLEGESSSPTPPTIIRETPKPAPAPRRPAPPAAPAPPPLPARSLHDWHEKRQHKPVTLEGVRHSISAYERATRVDDKARAHLRHASEQVREHGKTSLTRHDPESIQDARNLFRSPQNVRIALVASIIFGPPKAME